MNFFKNKTSQLLNNVELSTTFVRATSYKKFTTSSKYSHAPTDIGGHFYLTHFFRLRTKTSTQIVYNVLSTVVEGTFSRLRCLKHHRQSRQDLCALCTSLKLLSVPLPAQLLVSYRQWNAVSHNDS